MSFLPRLGALRSALLIVTLICYPLVWLADSEPEGIGVLTAYVVPSFVFILFFVLLLDALMNWIFMLEQTEEKRAAKKVRMWLDLAAFSGLVLFWWSYFFNIGAL